MVVKTIKLLNKLDSVYPEGIQVSIKTGIIFSTKAIYKNDELIYLFNIDEKFEFDEKFGYTKNEFISKYLSYSWKIEMIIS